MSATSNRSRRRLAAAGNTDSDQPLERAARRTRDRRRAALARKQPWWRGAWLIPGIVTLLAAVIIGFVIAGRQPASAPTATPEQAAQVLQTVTTVPAATFNAVGTGGLVNPLKPAQLAALSGPGGHPQVLYIGAEYCPYCASERWSLIAALSRFGTFNGLQLTTSSDADVFPNTSTFTFNKSSYTSQYVDFVPVETETRDRTPLQTPASAQNQLLNQLDPPGSIPFVDIANRYVGVGGGYSNDVLGGKDWTAIAASLNDPSSPVARAILGNANYLTAAICRATSDQPGDVCTSTGVSQAKAQLGG
jgi:hypothetical protein